MNENLTGFRYRQYEQDEKNKYEEELRKIFEGKINDIKLKGNGDIKMDIDEWDRLTLFDGNYTYTYNIVLNMNGDDDTVEFYDKVLWYSVLNNIS